MVATPSAYLPPVISPKKKSIGNVSGEEESIVDVNYVDDNTLCEANEFASNEEAVRLRPRAKQGDVDEEGCDSDNDSEDSDYVPEIVDSDYDLEDGDEDLVQEQLHSVSDMKGKQVVEDCNSEDEKLEAPESDEDEMKFNFKSFTAEDMHDRSARDALRYIE